MFLVVGLGNPGAKYALNRHNIGFMAADALAERFRAGAWSKKFNGLLAEAQGLWIRDLGLEKKSPLPAPRSPLPKLYFLKPQTYMNLSGESVGVAARFYKIPPEQVIVLYDELDLALGKLRVKQGGGAGGHNGIKSIDAHLGENYWRVRIGIGHPGVKHLVTNHVLGDFSKEEREVQEKMLAEITRHFHLMLENDSPAFMSKVAESTRDLGAGIRDSKE